MFLFTDPMLITMVLAIFAAFSAAGTSLVIAYHFEKLKKQTSALQKYVSLDLAEKELDLDQSILSEEEGVFISSIISSQNPDATIILNGHDPSKHVTYV